MTAVLVALVAAVVFGVLTALAVALVYPRLRRWTERLPGHLRAHVVLGILVAPYLAGILLGFLALLPGLLSAVWPALDHCAHHDDHHFHLCLVHVPRDVNLRLASALLVGGVLPAAIRLARTIPRIERARRVVCALERNARPTPTGGHGIVASDTAFALTVGLLQPRIYVTSRLLRELDVSSTQAVLAHEAAHVRRRDPLRKLVGELAATCHLARTRRILVDDLSLACEEACDEDAAATTGDRAGVAAALVASSRLIERAPVRQSLLATAFGDGHVVARVRSLLAPPKAEPALPSPRVALAATVVLAAGLTVPLHHLTETLLGNLLG